MSAQLQPLADEVSGLPALVSAAAQRLAEAGSVAEVLDAKQIAQVVYDAAKSAARLATARKAADDLIAAARRAQADAEEIVSGAKMRLAAEYEAAQERGEVAKAGQHAAVPDGNSRGTTADLGINRKDIMEGRQLNAAEAAEPGAVRRALDAALTAGEEPKAALKRALAKRAATVELKPAPTVQPQPEPTVEPEPQPRPVEAEAVGQRRRAVSGLTEEQETALLHDMTNRVLDIIATVYQTPSTLESARQAAVWFSNLAKVLEREMDRAGLLQTPARPRRHSGTRSPPAPVLKAQSEQATASKAEDA